MGRFTSGPKLGLLLAVVVGGVVFAIAFGGATRTATPVASSASNVSRDAVAAANGPTTAHLSAAKPFASKPQELVLTRAHGAVFDVRKLKSVVVKKERPEHEDPFGPPGGGDADMSAGKASGVDANADAGNVDAAIFPSKLTQSQMVKNSTNAPTPSSDISFDGLDFANWGAGHPPDENGDVGPNHYIQTVNTSIGIYDKSTGNQVAAFTFNTFMSQGHFGNLCDTNNFGDPVVLYDSFENRWFITDFAFALSGGNVVAPAYQCFAVSKTGDPVNGGWNFYSIQSPGALNDYPKFGVWTDGIYMTANMFGFGAGGSYQGYHVWALNKQQMYAGAPQVSVVDFSGDTSDFTVIPANARLQDGTPPAGSPEYFVSTEQFLNALSIYKFRVDWDKISTSTFTGPTTQLMPNCWPNATPSNALTPANAADTLPIRAMAQAQYTNQGGAESVWVAHTVQRNVSATNTTCNAVTGGNATVRWYQANVTGGTVAANVAQGSTFDPEAANTFFRYQPALAVDHSGDMGVTYTKSNSTTNPSIMFNGRLAGDPTNTLGTESTLLAGTGAQSGNCGSSTCVRWGDYAGMALDPDGCHFWMTGEYYAVNGLNDLTRIGSFHFPSCTPVGNGTLSGTVTDGSNPIAGATLTLGSRTTTTDASGNFSFTVPAGTYASLLADKAGYNEGSASSLVVPDGGVLTQNFTLSTAPTSGCFTDNSQSLFQRGTPSTKCDLTSSPGNIVLSNAPAVDQQNTAGTSTGTFINALPTINAQTFTAGATGQLTKADFTLFCSGCTSAASLLVSIRATSGGLPTGGDLASTTIAGSTSGSSTLFTASFSSPATVTAGTQYALLVRPTSSPGGSGYAWIRSSPSTYAGGSRVISTNSGSTWTADTTRDFNFHTFVSAGYAASATYISSMRDANPIAGSTAQWTTLSWTATTPANTAVKFQVAASNSQYGPWNYVGPDGTAGTYFASSGASLSQFNGFRYLRYEAFLSTSDPNVTPSLSSVTTCFQDIQTATTLTPAAASGTYGGTTTLSATLTAGSTALAGETVTFSILGNPVGGATTDVNGVATLSNVSLAGIGAGSYPNGVLASFAGDSGYAGSANTGSLTISKANQAIVITQGAPATAAVDDQFTVSATGGGSGNPIVYGSSGGCTNSGATYTITGSGACTVTYDQAGDSNYNAAPQLTESVNSSAANQTIHVTTHAPSSAAYGAGFSVAATGGNSGNPIVYGSSGGCTNTGSNYTMTSASVDCTVTYDQAGNSNYNAAPQVTETVTATKADQTIAVTVSAPSSAVYNSSFDVDASAPAGAVSFSSGGACTNVGSHYTMTSGTGTCTVYYDQPGDSNYNAAPQVSESVTASKADQSITFANPGTRTYGDADFDPGATASSGYAVTYGASGDCTIVSGLVHLTGAGSCTVTADQPGDANFNAAPQVQQTFTVNKADQIIVVGTPAPPSAVYGSGFAVAATGGGSGNPIVYGSSGGCTNASINYTMTSGTTNCVVTFDQAGDANYNAATQVTENVNAQKAAQAIVVGTHAPASAVYGTGFSVSASGGASGNPITYGSSGACTNTGSAFTMSSGTGTCTVTYDQAGDSNYSAAPQQSDSVTAVKKNQTIAFPALANRTYGAPDFNAGATASSGNAVSYTTTGPCSIVSGLVHLTGAGSCTVKANQPGDANYNAAAQVQRTFSIAKAALSITANNRTKYYDQALTLGTTAFTTSGLVGSDSISKVTLTSSGAAASAASGSYSIAVSGAVAGPGTSLANYIVTYHGGTLQVFPVGLIGLGGVSVTTSGGTIDSFDSTLGAYGPSNHGSTANVMSNTTLSFSGVQLLGSTISTTGNVTVASSASVSGNVTAGNTATILGTVGGTVTQHSPTTTLSTPAVAACSPYSTGSGISGGTFTYSSGNLDVKSGTVTLANGTYCFNNLTVEVGATLQVNGPVTINLSGKLAGIGMIANTTNLPANLHIATSFASSAGVSIVGGSNAAMTIVAPKTSVAVAGGSYFGTVLGQTVKLTGGLSYHADQH